MELLFEKLENGTRIVENTRVLWTRSVISASEQILKYFCYRFDKKNSVCSVSTSFSLSNTNISVSHSRAIQETENNLKLIDKTENYRP